MATKVIKVKAHKRLDGTGKIEDVQGHLRKIEKKVESRTPPATMEYSHEFINGSGNKVTQYRVSDGYGGYARVEHKKNGFAVTNIILDERVRGKGIATNFYKKINMQSLKETGKTLQSIPPDKTGLIELSDMGEGLWKGLVGKGVAKKVGNKKYRFLK